MAIVQGQLATAAIPTIRSPILDAQVLELPQLASFQHLSTRRERHDRWQMARPTQTSPPPPAWHDLRSHDQSVATGFGPQLPTLTVDQLLPSFGPLTAAMMQHQTARLTDLRSERVRDQQDSCTRARGSRPDIANRCCARERGGAFRRERMPNLS